MISDGAAATPTATAPAYGPIAGRRAGAGALGPSRGSCPWCSALMFLALAAIVALVIGALDTKNRQQGRVDAPAAGGLASPARRSSATAQETADDVLGDERRRCARPSPSRTRWPRAATPAPWRSKLDEAERGAAARRVGGRPRADRRPGRAAGDAALRTSTSLLTLARARRRARRALARTWATARASAAQSSTRCCPTRMQMLAGSLSAGYSLPQALDNVAQEAGGPWARRSTGPSSRAGSACRSRSPSRRWPSGWTARTSTGSVMAIRINRQVGGNLAEVLTNVAKTVRERERLRRQVKALSAEGKLSAWILALLPIGVGAVRGAGGIRATSAARSRRLIGLGHDRDRGRALHHRRRLDAQPREHGGLSDAHLVPCRRPGRRLRRHGRP